MAVPEITGPGGLLSFDGGWSQPLRPETANTDEPRWAHTRDRSPSGGPSGGRLPGSRRLTPSRALTSGFSVQGKLPERASQENCLGDRVGLRNARASEGISQMHLIGNQRLGNRMGMLGPLPPATGFLFSRLGFPICKPKVLTLTCPYWERSFFFLQLHHMVCGNLVP